MSYSKSSKTERAMRYSKSGKRECEEGDGVRERERENEELRRNETRKERGEEDVCVTVCERK